MTVKSIRTRYSHPAEGRTERAGEPLRADSLITLSGTRWRSRGIRSRLTVYCVRLHQLDAGAVGIIQIDLALLIDADLYGDLAFVSDPGGAPLQLFERPGGIGHHQRRVIFGAPFRWLRQLAVEHQLQIVVALRGSHVDPTQHRGRSAAAPEFLEAQNAAVELHGLVQIAR